MQNRCSDLHWRCVESSQPNDQSADSGPIGPLVASGAAWASPDISADLPRPAQREAVGQKSARATTTSSGFGLRDSPVARLSPRTVGQLLDGGFEVLRFRFQTLAIVSAVVVLPLYVVPTVLGQRSGLSNPFSMFDRSNPFVTSSGQLTGSYWSIVLLGFLAQLGLSLAHMLLAVAVGHLVTSWVMGQDPGPADTLRVVRNRLPVAVGAWIPILGLKVVSAFWLVSSVIAVGVSAVGGIIGFIIDDSGNTAWYVVVGVQVVVTVMMSVVQVGATVLAYINARVVTEGLDLELECRDRFDRAVG